MIYELINSKVCVARVFDRYNIDYSGWINRVPNWINGALGEMNIYTSLIPATVDGIVNDYKCPLPEGLVKLMGVSYMNYRLPRFGKVNENVADEMANLASSEYKYTLNINSDGTGYIITPFKECELGDLKFYIKRLPVTLDNDTNLYWALVPNNENVLLALDWYLLMRIMYRGHNLPTFSLTSPNRFNNPALAWEHYCKIGRIRARAIDADEREEISKLKRTLLVDYNNNNFTRSGVNGLISGSSISGYPIHGYTHERGGIDEVDIDGGDF